jgi:EAL domain-containing protein (putative c-di-GMP-specific phosphodiesterase class I)
MRDLAETRSLERGALERALGQGEFRLHYQPIVDLVAGEKCIGVEALLRWEHPERGLLPAAEFIDLAEVSGHLPAIGAWVIDAACAEAANLADGLCMSVNVSPHQLEDPGLADGVRRALAVSGLAPDRLVLEITETSDIADFDTAVERLQSLADLGVKIALDDFGTGYSTLNHLKRLPVQILKIDRAFVHNIVHSAEDRAIVRGVVDLARSFGLHTVVEGVEDDEQHRIVAELGCTFGQGYLWARPSLPADLPDLFIPAPPTAA